jgi:radical SAM protein with 4Fe4S-binding SPASM domain
MTTKYKRLDSSRISLLLSNKDMFNVIGKELGREDEFREYRRLFDESARDFKVMQKFPVHVDFEINFRCNYKCIFCTMSLPTDELKEWGDNTKSISLNEFKKIIDQGVKNGLKSVGFNGFNEPLTVPNLTEYIRYARDSKLLDIIFNTNGSLLTEDKARDLIDSGVTRIMISLDAFKKETYEQFRIGGDYDRVKTNILNLLKIRNSLGKVLPLVRLSFIANKNNVEELPDFIAFWKDKVDFFSIQSLGDPFLSNKNRSDKFRNLFKVNKAELDFWDCPQPFMRVLIRHNGDVIPCCSFAGMKLIVGNINKQSLFEIWNGTRIENIRQNVNNKDKQPKTCKACRGNININKDIDIMKYYEKMEL